MYPSLAWLVLPALLIAAPARSAETILHLNQSMTLAVAPDEMLAILRAEATAPSSAEAQARVNALARAAITAAEPAKDVRLATTGYHVGRVAAAPNDRAGPWRATQTFRLASGDGAALLTLVGALQQKGLAVTAMQWRLSPETERKARQSAARDVLKTLTERTTDAAEALGMAFSHFRAIQLDTEDPGGSPGGPSPRPMAMSRMADAPAPLAPPPTAQPDDVIITATAQVEAVLVKR